MKNVKVNTEFHHALDLLTNEIHGFLDETLPHIDADYWQKLVVKSSHIQTSSQNRLTDLDLAGLLKLFDSYPIFDRICEHLGLSEVQDARKKLLRNYIKELMTHRILWAHKPVEMDKEMLTLQLRAIGTIDLLLKLLNRYSDNAELILGECSENIRIQLESVEKKEISEYEKSSNKISVPDLETNTVGAKLERNLDEENTIIKSGITENPMNYSTLPKPELQFQQEIEDLRHSFLDEIQKIQDTSNVYQHLRKSALLKKLERLDSIESALAINKYTLAFIGTIGVGKTTAICHLFNLIGQFSSESDGDKKTSRIQELLNTGSGRTTICEVIIKPNDSTYIEIDPYPKDKLANLIDDFCNSFNEQNEVASQSEETISIELDRAIRNMIGFKKDQVTLKENGKKVSKRIDRAKEAFETLGLEEFKQMAFLNADLDTRTQTRVNYKSDDGDERVWVKRYFTYINQGKRKQFSIPKKIYLYLSQNILDASKLPQIDSIVDTKGLDENINRADINAYVDREDVICLFASEFNGAPETNIRELMKYHLSSRSRNFHHRFVTFIMPKKGQPEQENDGDGTWETGVEIKKEVIESVFKSLNLEFLPENIISYDALRYYHKGKIDPDYELDDIDTDRIDTIEKLNSVIDNRRAILQNEIFLLRKNLDEIKNGQALSNEELQQISKAVDEIKNYTSLRKRLQSFIYDEFIDAFIDYYRNVYKAWNTKHAIHRRFGYFYERDISIYYDGKIVAEGEDDDRMLRKFTRELKFELGKLIDGLGVVHRDLESLVPELKRQLEIYYDEFIQNVGQDVEDFLEKTKLVPQDNSSEFWNALMSEKGKPRRKGETYTDNVCLIFRRELEDPSKGTNLSSFLKESAERHWEELVNKLLYFFGE